MKLTQKMSLLLAAAVLAGCATAPKPIYHWDNYQATVYQYYKSDASPEQQIAALKESIEKSRAKGLPVPLVYMHIWACCMAILGIQTWRWLNLTRRSRHSLSLRRLWIS